MTTTPLSAPATVEQKTGPWLALLAAGGFEIGYALSVNGSEDSPTRSGRPSPSSSSSSPCTSSASP